MEKKRVKKQSKQKNKSDLFIEMKKAFNPKRIEFDGNTLTMYYKNRDWEMV